MYEKILVPVDGSDASKCGLEEAIKLTKQLGSRLRLLHVVNELLVLAPDQIYYDYTALVDSFREEGKRVLEAAAARAREEGLQPETELVEALGSRAADVIVTHAQKWGAQLIVIGTHGRRGLRRLALGSDAELVVRNAPVPVLLVRAQEGRQ
jgi:nucleotide-binding universal stress UspA family protein